METRSLDYGSFVLKGFRFSGLRMVVGWEFVVFDFSLGEEGGGVGGAVEIAICRGG